MNRKTSSPRGDTPRGKGLAMILSSPSGAGKTTLARALLCAETNLAMSVSVTTRPPRVREKDGSDYRFAGEDEFEEMRRRGDFLEYARIFGHRYGTPKAPVEEYMASGVDVLFDVDWQGARALRSALEDPPPVTVFLLPPSADELARRLRMRRSDRPDAVEMRMSRAAEEIGRHGEYDYVVVNDDVEDGLWRLRAILTAERIKSARRTWMQDFANDLHRSFGSAQRS